MDYQFSNLSVESFLAKYWQKHPVLIKAAFTDFIDPLSPDELAGLAAEEEIESRVIQRKSDKWDVKHGPFQAYDEFGESGWTLLVQAVDHWCEAGADLIRPFRFIPNWRIDDLMVSFSTPNGGVGPHLDQYDVFIVQGQGKRHWRVGLPQTLDNKVPHPDLLQVSEFEAIIDAVLEPGDMLYIPPNCPHEGYAVEPSLNYSIGFRAPNQQDLLSSFADFALQEECFNERYSDPDLTYRNNIGEFEQQDADNVIKLIQKSLLDTDNVNLWLGIYMTQAKHDLALETPEPEYEQQDVLEINQQIETWLRLGGLRAIVFDGQLYANGEHFELLPEQGNFALLLTNQDVYLNKNIAEHCQLESNLTLFTQLVNLGYIYPAE